MIQLEGPKAAIVPASDHNVVQVSTDAAQVSRHSIRRQRPAPE